MGFCLVGIVVLSMGGCVYVVLAPTADKKPVAREGYCPECGNQLPRGGSVCPYCFVHQQQAQAKKAAAAPVSRWKELSMRAKVGIFIGTSLLNVAVIYWGWFPRRKGPEEEEEVQPHRFRCPKCQRKVKYSDAKVGLPALCPGCKTPFIYPQPEPDPV